MKLEVRAGCGPDLLVIETDDWVRRNVRCGGLVTYWNGLISALRGIGAAASNAVVPGASRRVAHPSYYRPAATDLPLVVTVHDTIYEQFPGLADLADVVPDVLEVKAELVHRADVLVVPSRAVADELARWYPTDADKSVVVAHAVDPRFRPMQATSSWGRHLADLGVYRPYLVHVGGRRYYKGFVDLLRAYLLGGCRRSWDLLVLGGERRPSQDEQDLLDRYGGDGVVMVGGVSSRTIVQALTGAVAYVSASRAEGFGFGPLEALACRTPAVVADLDVHAETMGPAFVSWQPSDPTSLFDTVCGVVGTVPPRPALLDRRWVDVAQETCAAYTRAIDAHGHTSEGT